MNQSEQKVVARYIMKRNEDIEIKQASSAAISRLCLQHNIDAGSASLFYNLLQLIARADEQAAPMVLQEIIRYYQADARLAVRTSLRTQLESTAQTAKKHLWSYEHLKEAAR